MDRKQPSEGLARLMDCGQAIDIQDPDRFLGEVYAPAGSSIRSRPIMAKTCWARGGAHADDRIANLRLERDLPTNYLALTCQMVQLLRFTS